MAEYKLPPSEIEMLRRMWQQAHGLILQIKPESELIFSLGSFWLIYALLDDPEQLPDSSQFFIQLMKNLSVFEFETQLLSILPFYTIIFLHACWRMKTERVPWLLAYIDVFILNKE